MWQNGVGESGLKVNNNEEMATKISLSFFI